MTRHLLLNLGIYFQDRILSWLPVFIV